MRTAKVVWIGVALLVVGLGLLVACSSSSPQPSSAPAQPTTASSAPQGAPAVDGATLMNERCSVCHTTDRIKNAKKSQADWDATVTRMIGHGAKLSAAEKPVLVDYLAKTYGQ